MNITRRNFLKRGGLGLTALGLNMPTPGWFSRRALAVEPTNNKKMIFIFQKGGNDGINTLIPRGDSDYNTRNRPTLFINESQAIDAGNGFAQLHPALAPMLEIYNRGSINGQDGPGNLAVLHRIGYEGQTRSHFDSQHYWNNGIPGDNQTEEGFIYRHLDRTLDLSSPNNSFIAAGLDGNQLLALKGQKMIPNFSQAEDFRLPGGDKFLGSLPSGPDGLDARGVSGLYGLAPGHPNKPYRGLVHGAGQALGKTMEIVQSAVDQGPYTPENGAVYPTNNRFGRRLQEAAMLLKRTDVRILGLEINGWDTHRTQGQLTGDHARLLGSIATGYQALYRDLQSQWDDLIIVTLTEFGRTSKENGSRGSDHAESSVMFVGGGGVRGGVYNCDATSWGDGAMFSARNRYLSRRTDFRAVFGEVFQRHFGDAPTLMDDIMPGYSVARLDNPDDFEFLNFLSG